MPPRKDFSELSANVYPFSFGLLKSSQKKSKILLLNSSETVFMCGK